MSSRATNLGSNNTPSNLIIQVASNAFIDNSLSATGRSRGSISHTPINLAQGVTPRVRQVETLVPQDQQPQLNRRSCVTCRRRKVRCNKRHPCSNCVKAGIECVFPALGRVPRRPKQQSGAELLGILRRLEGVVENLGGNVVANGATSATSNARPPSIGGGNGNVNLLENDNRDGCPNVPYPDHEKANGQGLHEEFGRLMVDEGESRYVGDRFWASLEAQIEEMQDILDPSSEDEEEYPSVGQSVYLGSYDGFLFGYHSVAHTLYNYHPTPTQLFVMWRTYEENVAPLITILHRPSIKDILDKASTNLDSLDKNTEALVFAVYLSAVISMTAEQCVSQLGEERETTIHRYRFAVEQALARANFLESQNLMLLQATVLFLTVMRREDDTRFLWTMSAVVFRLAQGLGLHRDGSNFGLKPFETEMRRRLWWHICLLDMRSSEDHGSNPQIYEAFCDTRLPLNINDGDIFPDSHELPEERIGCTDMMFSLIRFEVTVARRLCYVPPNVPCPTLSAQRCIDNRENVIKALTQRFKERYLQYCDMTVPAQWICATTARLILAKLWLTVYQPLTKCDYVASLSQQTRDQLFLASIEVIEFAHLLETNENTVKWSWLFRTYIQWHAVAFVLLEICLRPIFPDVDRAWMAVNSVYSGWELQVTQKKGMLWKPLSRLMKRASDFRIKQKEELGLQLKPNQALQPAASSIVQSGVDDILTTPQFLPQLQTRSTEFQQLFALSSQGALQNLGANEYPLGFNKDMHEMLYEMVPGQIELAERHPPSSSAAPSLAQTNINGPYTDLHGYVASTSGHADDFTPQTGWAAWSQLMHEFQMDIQQTDGPPPLGNISDGFG